jgi:ribosomal protein L11 methylase PrmA
MLGLIDNLHAGITQLVWRDYSTEWGNYYDQTNYSPTGLDAKGKIIVDYLDEIQPDFVWDLGANTGQFSQLASQRGIPTIAFDIDPVAVEKCYLHSRTEKDENLLPLLLDLTNPSPAIGWHNQERASFLERGPVHTVMALALIHHLAISNNVPLERVAELFSTIGQWLIIEFVPKNDSQVQRLLATRQDIFPNYTPAGFESAFESFFEIHHSTQVSETNRCIYLMKKR